MEEATAEEEEEACGFFFLTFFLGFCVVASARAWIKWAGGWDWTLSLPSSPRTIQGMKSCWKAVLPRGEEGVGLGGANEMSNSIGSEEEEEERAQRRERMGRKRGERGKGLVLRKEAAKDIGEDATDAIFADGREIREKHCVGFLSFTNKKKKIKLFFF